MFIYYNTQQMRLKWDSVCTPVEEASRSYEQNDDMNSRMFDGNLH